MKPDDLPEAARGVIEAARSLAVENWYPLRKALERFDAAPSPSVTTRRRCTTHDAGPALNDHDGPADGCWWWVYCGGPIDDQSCVFVTERVVSDSED